MARVTVEDCVTKVPNRFELVMKAAQRAREIAAGSTLSVDRDNDKNPVVALREIADTSISLEELEEALVKNLQKFVEADEPEEDQLDFTLAEGAEGDEEPVHRESLVGGADSELAANATAADATAAEEEGAEVRFENVEATD